ncbi:Putative nitroreductase TM1586 [Acididesulfobacillus acetoxydans]|uniref:Nitroreductase TM1586 n=1 Tax=Acididesulfobacillus acetoxydans TaxID=1561005 RepID=A0A8S0W8W6_9FIRM|nr:nitroreductase family protein [Acididesulfobacillus acetoxydans]CAA7602149.1 Putative nitroreductase TM1586 [Acididesulfobacillus acetoxydans]CEJ08008.1 Nitroreductase protein [Acididesulfobacillus acetoxydans]
MDFLQLAKTRCSVRKYLPRKVEREKLLKILEAGRIAPTAANMQPQRLLVVEEEDGLAKLRKAANIYDAPLALIICSDRQIAWKRPFDGKTTVEIDAAIVTAHMMLEATELGLGTVWVGYFKPDVIVEEFHLPGSVEPIAVLPIGYPAGETAPPDRHERDRKPLSHLVSYETYQA